jgi:hypothetical protein
MTTQGRSILLYGVFAWDSLGASYERAFEQLGHQVARFDVRKQSSFLSWWLANRLGHRLTINSFRLRRLGARKWNKSILDKARNVRPDVTLILNGDFVMPETVQALRRLSNAVFIFHADNPFPSSPNHRPEFLPAAQACDGYFIWSRVLQERLQNLGVRCTTYLPFGWDPEAVPATEPASDPKYDVTFIGNWDRRRERWLTPVAEQFDLKIWGANYWNTRTQWGSPLRQCWQGRPVHGQEAAEVISQSKISLNILRKQNLPDGTNMRTFEVAGCGGFMLATETEGAAELFSPGEAGVYFATPAELVEQIAYYLNQDEKRLAIARKAQSLVREKHRYRDRVQTMLDKYKKL